jgi:hypothetical protein
MNEGSMARSDLAELIDFARLFVPKPIDDAKLSGIYLVVCDGTPIEAFRSNAGKWLGGGGIERHPTYYYCKLSDIPLPEVLT